MKLQKYLFSELTKEVQQRVIDEFSTSGYNPEYLTQEDYSTISNNAEIVTNEGDGDNPLLMLIDIRVFDPYNHISHENYACVGLNYDGWSGWLYDYRDDEGNDIDTIFEKYNGETQDLLF